MMDGHSMPDLFGHGSTPVELATYPDKAGYRGTAETSAEAAEAINPRLGRYQRAVLGVIEGRGANGATSEEIADLLGLPPGTAQPRTSELAAKGLIVDSRMRRVNTSSRKRAIVWVLACHAPE